MAEEFKSGFLLEFLGNALERFPKEDRETLLAIWETWIDFLADQLVVMAQTDLAKSLRKVPVKFRRESIAFRLDATTQITDTVVVERGGGVTIASFVVGTLAERFAFYWIDIRRDPVDPTKTRVRVFDSQAAALADADPIGETFSPGFGTKTNEPIGGMAGATITYTYTGRPAEGALTRRHPDRIAFGVNDEIESIPELFGKTGIGADSPFGTPLTEGVDYKVQAGVLIFAATPPNFLFAKVLFQNRELIFDNFGFLIDFFQENSRIYRQAMRGLWFAFWNGPTLANIELGATIILGFPIGDGGRVLTIGDEPGGAKKIIVEDREGVVDEHIVAAPFVPYIRVTPGFTSDGFYPLVVPFEVVDFIKDKTIAERLSFPPVQQFFRWFILVDAAVWEAFVAEAMAAGEPIQLSAIGNFVQRIKPKYTDGLLVTRLDLADSFGVATSLDEEESVVDGTERVNQNNINLLFFAAYQVANGFTEVDYAAGARQDLNIDAGVLGLRERVQVLDFDTAAVLYEEPT